MAPFMILTLIAATLAKSVDFDCNFIRDTPDETQVLRTLKQEGKEQRFDKKCLQFATEKHFFNVGEYLIEEFYAKENIDVTDVMKQAVEKLEADQRKLSKALAKADRDINEIMPPFRWAQSLNHIYIKTKYAHRIDAPTCGDVFDQKIKMTDTSLNLTAKCRKDHETQFFSIPLKLVDKINVKESEWKKNDTDGTIQLELKKQMYGRWP